MARTGVGKAMEDGYASAGSTSGLGAMGVDKGKARVVAADAGENGGKSPVDKNFLLGFLNDVARKGR
jgi:mRNA-decapping enzyme subunit 2